VIKKILRMWKYEFILLLMCLIVGCGTVPKKKIPKTQADEIFRELEKEEQQKEYPEHKSREDVERELLPPQDTLNKLRTPKVLDEKTPKASYGREPQIYQGDKIFEEIGVGIASKYEKPIDAEKRAIEDALNKVMKKAGVDVYYGFSDTLAQYGDSSYQFVARYLLTWSKGIVSYEEVDKEFNTNSQTGEIKCMIKIKGEIYYRGKPDPGYEIRIDMSEERKLGIDKLIYHPGENVKLSLRVTRDSYINILNIDEDGNVYLLYPNKFVASNFIKAGKIFKFPGKAGIDLKAVLPEGRKETMELLHIIATKHSPLFVPEETIEVGANEYFFKIGKLKDVIRRLAKLDRDEWTMMVIPYCISTKK
jgi:hypothetical protein